VKRIAGVLNPRAERLDSHCLAYVVRHPRAGTFLIDTGFHPDASSDLRRDFGGSMSLLFRGLEPAEAPYEQQLREVGVEPREVERVVMTHLHVDHTSGMRLLPSARFTIGRREWAVAQTSRASARGFVSAHLPPEARVDLVDPERDGARHGPFGATLDLLGDGSVRLVSTPGHTPGHISVLVRVDGGHEVLVVGDAAYTRRSIDEQIAPLLTADDDRYRRTLAELKAFTEQRPDAIVVPSHDPTAWHDLEAVSATAQRALELDRSRAHERSIQAVR
jgi:glyoxylase-like metal-dependent hydrolase (beta-lactamase superfamily II)